MSYSLGLRPDSAGIRFALTHTLAIPSIFLGIFEGRNHVSYRTIVNAFKATPSLYTSLLFPGLFIFANSPISEMDLIEMPPGPTCTVVFVYVQPPLSLSSCLLLYYCGL
jgi:hypothetical protein